MKNLLLIASLLTHSCLAQQVAVTLDDLPFGYSAGMSDSMKIASAKKILTILEEFDIKATGFVTSSNMSEENQVILDMWLKEAHDLGNHTHRHYNFNEVTAAKYIADIDSCKLLAGEWINTDYFRYSMLRRGNTKAKRDSVYAFLETEDYIIAPVSIDNNEWIYNRDYSRALRNNDEEKMIKIGNEYIEHMKEVSLKYEKMGVELTGRSVRHILLLHANPINAKYLHTLLGWYKSEGWEFITLQEAMEDSIYATNGDLVSDYGWSQIDKLQKIGKK
ncbi:polysaccharide deacetylase family protein [Ekhidna sp. MALMAid0563]|uniref:polysaccharide deacetylase family protein n=1 Tax=Ekhidna sp. MALMAid0563 TaxID=3143937 RepID=UPI0032DE76EA